MLVYNAVKCLGCGEILHSKHRHDYQSCECGSFTDGGSEYQRYGGNVENLSLASDAPHKEIREKLKWGRSYDALGNRLPETEWVLIKDLTQDHLGALIVYTKGDKIFVNEKQYRLQEQGLQEEVD